MKKEIVTVEFFKEAKEIESEIISNYRSLHKIPETGFALNKTAAYVKCRLDEMGIEHSECGENGIVALIGNKRAHGCILLRADMDALPIREETNVGFKSENGAMHACGHDAHTAMLLGAAKILKKHESELVGCVKLVFQPAEELLEGAKNMIDSGVLENPKADAAVMLHVIVGTELKSGSVIISSGGVSAPSADYFQINVKGRGCHGSTPDKGRDPLAVACRIATALDEIKAKELSISEKAVITVGCLIAGNTPNVIPDSAVIKGSMRAFDEDTRRYIKERIGKIVSGIAGAFETEGVIDFYSGAPSLLNDERLSGAVEALANATLSPDLVKTSAELNREAERNGRKSEGAGSEDFAYISRKVPSVMIGIAAGSRNDGYTYPLHHPKVIFDEKAFVNGSALLAKIGAKLPNTSEENHQNNE